MNRTMLGGLATLLLVAGVLLGILATRQKPSVHTGTARAPEAEPLPGSGAASEWMKEFTLTERSGRRMGTKDLAGKVHVVNFFFAKCPTVCRTQTAAVKGIAKEYGPQGVVFLSITVDPENDTPAALSLYAKEFEADPDQWLFLTGDLAYIRRVGAEVYFSAVDRLTHTESLIVVDKKGAIRGRFAWKDVNELATMKKLLTELLQEPVSAT